MSACGQPNHEDQAEGGDPGEGVTLGVVVGGVGVMVVVVVMWG